MNPHVTREELHARSIKITGYRRSDGLYEIEGRLLDTKPFDFKPVSGDRVIAAGEPIHHMGVRLVYDETMTVRDVIAVADAVPYAECTGGPSTLKSLIGLSMTSGWSAETRKRLAGSASCVHLAGLMVPMAATAFQSMVVLRLEQRQASGVEHKPSVDSCLAYSRHGELMRTRYPTFYMAKVDADGHG
jgi:Protein of unknown function (DUF2889)